MNILGKLLLSFLFTNWLYSEAVIIYPPLDILGQRFLNIARIPTHDEWPEIADSPHAVTLERNLTQALNGYDHHFFGKTIRRAWNGGGMLVRTNTSTFESESGRVPVAAVGEAVFVHPSALQLFGGEVARF